MSKWFGLVEDDKPAKEVQTQAPAPMAPTPMVGTGGADDGLVGNINDNIKTKAPANVYFKLRTSMDLMIANKLDESSAAKGSAAVLGIQGPAVLSAIDDAVALVEGERTLFSTTVYKDAVAVADGLAAHSTDLQAQINDLLAKVKELSEQNIQTQQDAAQARNSADVLGATFDASAAKLISILNSEKQKLTTYLS